MKPMVQRALIGALALAALAAGVWVGQGKNLPPIVAKATAVAPAAHEKLAALTLPDLAGTPQAMSQWRGKIWVVNFWATWCTPCREEMPMLAAASQRHEGRVQFLGIGIDSPEKMQAFLRETPVPYPLLVGGNEVIELTAELGNSAMALPYTLVLDANGMVRGQHLGKITEVQLEGLLKTAGL